MRTVFWLSPSSRVEVDLSRFDNCDQGVVAEHVSVCMFDPLGRQRIDFPLSKLDDLIEALKEAAQDSKKQQIARVG